MADPGNVVIELSNVVTGFPNRNVLSGVSLSVARGELVIIEGATGAGKTTLMRTLLGAQPLQSGYAKVLNTDLLRSTPFELERLRHRIGVIFQFAPFLNQENVLTNAVVPLLIGGVPPRKCRAEGTRALVDVGLAGCARKKPLQLSGGEQARLQIARALIHKPYLVLADEPFAHLDPESAIAAESLLAAVHARGTAVVITTHRPTNLAAKARRYRLEGGKLI
ncbi:MAG: cell division ATP-binding protein FtsE [Calditrichota bacterium]